MGGVERADMFCEGGCKIPFTYHEGDVHDPFVEFDDHGFRGFGKGGAVATCGRSCSWYNSLQQQVPMWQKDNMISDAEKTAFESYCSPMSLAKSTDGDWGFKGRARVSEISEAPQGAMYWWDGRNQYYPNVKFQASALEYAQTSYFISIIVVRWADILIAKTRKLSLFEQGMQNGFMNFGLCFETILGACLLYVPFLNQVFGTRPLAPLHWFPGVPWSILIFLYDETRKMLMRQDPNGWLEQFTYW